LCKILLKRMHSLKVSVILKDLHFFLHIDYLCIFVQSFLCKILLRRMHPLKVNVFLKNYISIYTLIVYAYLCNPFCVQLIEEDASFKGKCSPNGLTLLFTPLFFFFFFV
jgi:hypothetical protein